MSVLASLFTGVSGLAAQGEALGVIGDNIANAHTTGFKASRGEFQDIMAKNLKGVLGGNQIGRGVKLASVNPIFTQGNIDSTEKATDLAISGDGFFVLNGNDGTSYTRDGSFHFDKDGYLVTNDNQRVQGYTADDKGRIINEKGDIAFPRAIIPARPSGTLNLTMQLDSRMDNAVKPWDPKDPVSSSQYSTGVEVYDSQGNKHLMNVYFRKTADRSWEWHGMCQGKEVVGGVPGEWAEVAAGTLGFNQEGRLDTEVQTKTAFNFAGGALQNQQIKVDFGDALTTDKGIRTGMANSVKGSTQYGKESDIIIWNQDGAAAGNINNLSFADDGTLSALYSNGETRDLAQVVLAKFENGESMFKVGNNRFKESKDSGTPSVGKAGQAGRGKFYAKSLERSTVDLAMEFVGLIQNQRGFQANAKTITTTDELLQEVINLKRS